MKKKYIVLIVLMVFFIAITPACFNLAYLQRGYRAIGGEALVPMYGLILWSIWQEVGHIFRPEYEVEENEQ